MFRGRVGHATAGASASRYIPRMDQASSRPGVSAVAPEIHRRPTSGLVGRLLVVDLAGAFLGLFPAYFLAVGIQAIGAANGWWIGDPTANDGEETFATFIGAVGSVVVLLGIVVAATHYARGYPRPALTTNVYNTVAFVVVYASAWVAAFVS